MTGLSGTLSICRAEPATLPATLTPPKPPTTDGAGFTGGGDEAQRLVGALDDEAQVLQGRDDAANRLIAVLEGMGGKSA